MAHAGLLALRFAYLWDAPSDYTAFYTAWTIVREGQGARLYDLAYQGEVQEHIVAAARAEAAARPAFLLPYADMPHTTLAYVNPPQLALALAPLGWLPLRASLYLWTAAQIALLGWVLAWLWRNIAAKSARHERLLLTAAILAFPPTYIALGQGTFSVLLLAAAVLLYEALTRRQDGRAGAWLALLLLKPQLVVAPGAMAAGGQRWRVLGSALIITTAAIGVTMAALGPIIHQNYLGALREYGESFDRYSVEPTLMWNARAALTLLLGRGQAPLINALSLALLAVVGIGVLALWRGRWDPGTRAFDLRFALTLGLGALIAPHLNPQDGLQLVLPAALGYRALREVPDWGWRFGAFVLACPLLLEFGDALPLLSTFIRLPVLLTIVLVGWLALGLRRTTRLPASGESAVQIAI